MKVIHIRDWALVDGAPKREPYNMAEMSDLPTTSLILADATFDVTLGFIAIDVHNNGTVVQFTTKSIDSWFLRVWNTVSYAGTPDKIQIQVSLNALDSGASNYWSRPKMRVIRWGNVIAVFDDLVMQQDGAYDGDFTLVWSFLDKQPWANPSYTFEWFDKENRTATLIPASYSQLSLTATEKINVLS